MGPGPPVTLLDAQDPHRGAGDEVAGGSGCGWRRSLGQSGGWGHGRAGGGPGSDRAGRPTASWSATGRPLSRPRHPAGLEELFVEGDLAVVEGAETYWQNADDPPQREGFAGFREHLAEDPQWYDGEVVDVCA